MATPPGIAVDDLAPLPLLAEPAQYRACTWDLSDGGDKCQYWLNLFQAHFPSLLDHALEDAQHRGAPMDHAREMSQLAQQAFDEYLDELRDQPTRYGPLDILAICVERERVLRQHGFDDPYRLAKSRENEAAMALLPALLQELDALDPAERAPRVMRGVFAGNIFDLGATKTAAMFRERRVDFHDTLAKLKARPWLVDDLDPWLARLKEPAPHRAALLLVDNAGCDVVLGMLPLARTLLQRGTRVILAANTQPSLNDITHRELSVLVGRLAGQDPLVGRALEEGQLQLVPSGCGTPLIDLSIVSQSLAKMVRDFEVDLVVLEGMGRALESNFNAKLSCETLKLAMIKDQGVADALGGEIYDLVLRYDRP